MPVRRYLNLKNLCYKTLAKHFDELQDEIAQLPLIIIEEIYNERNSLNFSFAFAPSEIFIHKRKVAIESNFKNGSPKYTFRNQSPPIPYDCYVLGRITAVCKNLKCLKIQNQTKISTYEWQQLFRSISQKIEIIELKTTSCCNSVLTTIGSNCTKLRNLNLSNCGRITDDGIRNLCIDYTTDSSRNMQIEELNISDTRITQSGCLIALQSLPWLKRFVCHGISLFHVDNMLKMFSENRDYTFPSIEYFNCGKIDSVDKWKKFSVAFPNCTNIELSAERSSIIDFNGIVSLPVNFQNVLTHFELCQIELVDLALIGRLYPELRVLKLENVSFSNSSQVVFDTNRVAFKNLIEIDICPIGMQHCYVPEEPFRMMLENCADLKKLILCKCSVLSDEVVRSFVLRNGLKYLQHIELQFCNSITVKSLYRIFSVENPLSYAMISNCRKIADFEHERILGFLRGQTMDLEVNFAPSRLRSAYYI